MSNPNILPFRVGIAPAKPVTFSDEVEVGMDQPALRILGMDGKPISATPDEVDLVGVTGESLNSLTWPTYLAWRKSKCRPFANEGTRFAVKPNILTGNEPDESAKRRALEEIDQATLEFIGEVAELGELFIDNGPVTFFGNLRDKLIDECGDIFFCGMWALDAWGQNPFYEADDLEMIRVTPESELAMFAEVLASRQPGEVLGNQQFASVLGGMIFNFLMSAQTNAGLLANSFKKLRYQRRAQDVDTQVTRIGTVFLAINQILIIANSSVEEALKSNMRKLDARFPEGYKPGVGGGIRTGEGA